MCGIGGYYRVGYHTPKSTAAAVRTLWLALMDRGTHAAGLAVLDSDTGTPAILKAGAPASHIARMATGAAFDGSQPPRWVMLHTRHATSGSTANNLNNHPLGADLTGPAAVCLIHNGVITNKAAVLKALNVDAARGVDSEAALACVRAGGVAKVAELCAGSMALVWNVGANIHLWTDGVNPLALGCLKSGGGGWLWASTRRHLEATGLTFGQIFDADKNREYILTPDGLRRGRLYPKKQRASILADWATFDASNLSRFGGVDICRPAGAGRVTVGEAAAGLHTDQKQKGSKRRKIPRLRRPGRHGWRGGQRWDTEAGGWIYYD